MKLNDVFEFVGIFTFDPDLTIDRDDKDEVTDNFCEDALVYLPPIKVGLIISPLFHLDLFKFLHEI